MDDRSTAGEVGERHTLRVGPPTAVTVPWSDWHYERRPDAEMLLLSDRASTEETEGAADFARPQPTKN